AVMDTGTNKRQNNNSNSEAQKKRSVTLTNKQRYDLCFQKKNEPNSKEATNKRSKKPVFVDIESAVALWVEHVIGNKQTLTGYLIQNKAKEFATLLNEDKFNASNSWLHNFKKRHNIREYKRQGEADSAPLEELPEFR
ncbi:16129_t:CDS:2, partial [Dentiscutata erythropus]